MSHNYFIILLVMLIFSTQSCNNDQKELTKVKEESRICREEIADKNQFNVIKIDSLKNFYIIIAKKENDYYKIISEKKTNFELCDEIKICNHLELNLNSIVPDTSKISFKVAGVLYKEVEFEFEGDSIMDIYETDDLRGLCVRTETK